MLKSGFISIFSVTIIEVYFIKLKQIYLRESLAETPNFSDVIC